MLAIESYPDELDQIFIDIDSNNINIMDLLKEIKLYDDNITLITLCYFQYKNSHAEISADKLIRFIGTLISKIDLLISRQVNQIIHKECFQKLESSWRGIEYLVSRLDVSSSYIGEKDLKVKLLNITWNEISRDISKSIDFDQSHIFKKVYSDEFDLPGGEPYGLLVCDYEVKHKPINDIETLRGLTQVAAAAFSPMLFTGSHTLLGLDDFDDLHPAINILDSFSTNEFTAWRSLRELDDARFLGVLLPKILMRSVYRDDGTRLENFRFEETTSTKSDFLWGSPSYAFAAIIMRAHAMYGWYADIRGMKQDESSFGTIESPGSEYFVTDPKGLNPMQSCETKFSNVAEQDLHRLGIIPVKSISSTPLLLFNGNYSMHSANNHDSKIANANEKLSSMLQYMLCVSRFAHYVKVMARDRIGSYTTAEEMQKTIYQWLLKYTVANEDASIDIKARFPLRDVNVEVKELVGKPGEFSCVLHLRPHYQLDDVVSSMKLRTILNTVGEK